MVVRRRLRLGGVMDRALRPAPGRGAEPEYSRRAWASKASASRAAVDRPDGWPILPLMAPGPGPPFPLFDVNQFVGLMSRFFAGPEQAMRVYRELLGLEAGAREKSVDFMAQLARGYGMDATPLFEGVLRFGPTDTARVAAAAYLAEHGREDTVLEVLESLRPPVLTMTLLSGLAEVLATRPARADRIERLVA